MGVVPSVLSVGVVTVPPSGNVSPEVSGGTVGVVPSVLSVGVVTVPPPGDVSPEVSGGTVGVVPSVLSVGVVTVPPPGDVSPEVSGGTVGVVPSVVPTGAMTGSPPGEEPVGAAGAVPVFPVGVIVVPLPADEETLKLPEALVRAGDSAADKSPPAEAGLGPADRAVSETGIRFAFPATAVTVPSPTAVSRTAVPVARADTSETASPRSPSGVGTPGRDGRASKRARDGGGAGWRPVAVAGDEPGPAGSDAAPTIGTSEAGS